MVHLGLAKVTGIEEIALTAEESQKLGAAIARVQSFYPNTVMSGEVMAWGGLIITAGTLYAPRYMAFKLRMAKEAAEKPTARANQTLREMNLAPVATN